MTRPSSFDLVGVGIVGLMLAIAAPATAGGSTINHLTSVAKRRHFNSLNLRGHSCQKLLRLSLAYCPSCALAVVKDLSQH